MRARRRFEIAILLLVASMVPSGPTSAQVTKSAPSAPRTNTTSTQKPGGAAARLTAIVASGRLEDLRWPNFSDYRPQLVNFYRSSGYKPAWVGDGAPTAQAVQLIQILQNADQDGL